ncbi:hypothetical protein ABZ949_02250 [Micromonospora tulbaghiae]|uniref:hypothetical protein n=1 Tax=Micromonospora tulbaghiae TaxID=479978 RepID=UPI0033C6F5C7
MAGLYPGTSAVRVFFGVGDGLPASAWTDKNRTGRQRLTDLPAGCHLIVSFKDQNVDRLAFVQAWQQHRPDVTVDLITHHEPEQQEGGDPTPEQYRASWTRTREQLADHPARAEGRLRLATCWTLQWIRRGGDWRTWWPGHEADAVDLLLFDWYPFMAGEPNPWKPRVYEDPASALKTPIDIARQLGRDWGIAEVDHPRILRANGFTVDLDPDGTLAAIWYRATYAAARETGCRVWVHFHADAGAAVGDLTKRPAEQQVFRQLIAEEAAMTWRKGQPWRTVRSLDRLNEQIRAAFPGAVPPATPAASWGSIADSAHSTTSDHYPHVYKALGATAVVCARDFPHAPSLGMDAHKIAEQLRLSRDPRIGYIISNGRITGPNYGWKWSAYSGSDPHDTHIHVSTVHTAAADSGADWQIGDDDMPLTSDDIEKVATATKQKVLSDGGIQLLLTRVYQQGVTLAAVQTALGKLPAVIGAEGTNPAELKAALDALPKPGDVDEQAIVAGVLAGIDPATLAARIAEHLPADQAQRVADELAARLAA